VTTASVLEARFGKLAPWVVAAEARPATAPASAAGEEYDISRHWRHARTRAGHDPVDRKYHQVGNYLLNSVALPNRGQI
jgi:hypothetical protein